MPAKHKADTNAPRSRPELASIYISERAITLLELEADRRNATRISVADEIIGRLADEVEGKAPPLVPVRCSVVL